MPTTPSHSRKKEYPDEPRRLPRHPTGQRLPHRFHRLAARLGSPPRLEISQWADAYRKIARGSGAEPGQWRTDRHPPLREIMNCLSDHTPVQQVSFMKSGQIGATEIGINWVCYVIDRGIDSMIVTQPVKDLARTWTVAKFDPGVLDMPPCSTN
ncbi:phage terminase large subunit family protein [Xylella fastidiosa]|uniref:phage terminase large subunit family protein n=1 Tax=Xylella fastidiosa TaxID=2371 RepID=UPI0022789B30